MSAYDSDNIFAKILAGDIPCHKVFEDEYVLAIMDVMPQSEGHTLVVPKAPSRNLLDADPEQLAQVIKRIQIIAQGVKKAFGADGLRLVQLNEAAANQTVFHLHFHIIPVYEGIALHTHNTEMADNAKLAANAKRLAAALA